MIAAKIAREVIGFVQDAVGEMANDMIGEGSGFLDEKWDKKIKKAKKQGVRDIQGWLADELYNDPDTLSDLMGDRIHDLVKGNEDDYKAVVEALTENAHPGLKKACVSLLKENANG